MWAGRIGVTLEAFLRARLDEDEAYLKSNSRHLWTQRPLREVEAKRAILDMYEKAAQLYMPELDVLEDVLRCLAAVYSDHPDYGASAGILNASRPASPEDRPAHP